MISKLITYILIIGLLMSTAVGFLFAYSKHKANLNLRLEPIAKVRGFDYKAPLSQTKKIVLFGDSRIEQYRDSLKVSDYATYNMGISGETSGQAKYRVERDILNLSPKVAVLQLGVNDLKTIAFAKETKEGVISSVITNLTEIVSKLRDNDIKVVLLTVIPASEPVGMWRVFWNNDVDEAIATVNQAILEMASEGIVVLDSQKVFQTNNNRLDKRFATDTLHLNQSAYAQLSEAIKQKLQYLNIQ